MSLELESTAVCRLATGRCRTPCRLATGRAAEFLDKRFLIAIDGT